MSDAVNSLLAAIAQGQTVFNQLVVKNANLQAQFLPFVSFAEACLLRVDFRHSILPGANFGGARMTFANLDHVNLLGANLAGADLAQASLEHALLGCSNLVGVNLANANLTGASLTAVDLTSANLRNANLAGANLKGANLSKANLFGARLDPHALTDVILDATVMPDGRCLAQTESCSKDPTGPVNLTSYPRLASTLSTPSPSTAPAKAQNAPPVMPTRPPQSANSSATVAFLRNQNSPKHVWFQFSENSSDLDLGLVQLEGKKY